MMGVYRFWCVCWVLINVDPLPGQSDHNKGKLMRLHVPAVYGHSVRAHSSTGKYHHHVACLLAPRAVPYRPVRLAPLFTVTIGVDLPVRIIHPPNQSTQQWSLP